MIVLAHRGASGTAPENTMAAFRRAAELGADGLELDVQRSADGAVVVLHDADVRRTSDGTGPVASLSLPALRRLDFGGWFSPAFRGEPIPLLAEVADFVAARGLWLNIELKGDPDLDPALPGAVAAVVRGRLDPARTILSTFDAGSWDAVAAAMPGYPRALLVERLDADAWRLLARRDASGAPFFRFAHPGHRAVTASSLARLRAAGLRVHPWTLDRPRPTARMLALGVDGIITGFPERVRGR